MIAGDTFVCPETGKTVTVESVGFSYNYVITPEGVPISDEGVDIREKRQMQEREGPFHCYLSSDLKTVTGWKGNVHGKVHTLRLCQHLWTRDDFYSFRVTDSFGKEWYGRGSPDFIVTLRPVKD